MHARTHGSLGLASQRGIVSILAAFLLVLLISVLALVVDTGRLYLEQRKLQKVADMAALDAISRLPRGTCATNPARAGQFAAESAALNGFTPGTHQTLTVQCATIASQNGLRNVTAASSGAGVRVEVSHQVPASLVIRGGSLFSDAFSGHITLRAHAAAQRNAPVAAFSVKTHLLSLDNTQLMGSLLRSAGVDTTRLGVLNSSGALTTFITAAELLAALGINVSVDDAGRIAPASIAAARGVRVSDVVRASATLAGNSTLATTLSGLATHLSASTLTSIDLLGSTGLFQLEGPGRPSTLAALQAELALGEMLGLAIVAGSRKKSVSTPGINLLGLASATGVIDTPTLAAGTVGSVARAGQTRLHLDIDSQKMVSLNPLTGRIHLPLTMDLASATGELTSIQCNTPIPTVDIAVSSSLLDACLGDMSASALWENSQSCAVTATDSIFAALMRTPPTTLLGPGKRAFAGQKSGPQPFARMAAGEKRSYQPLALPTISSLLTTLQDGMFGILNSATSSANTQMLRQVARDYLDATSVSSGRYDPARAASLVLNGGTGNSGRTYPRLASTNWTVANYKCANLLCTSLASAPFSTAFVDLANNGGLLGTSLLPVARNGYQACGGLLLNLLFYSSYNSCVEENLILMLQRKPGGLEIPFPGSGADSGGPANCQEVICRLVRIPLNSTMRALGTLITSDLGLDLGRIDVRVESITCGDVTFVQ
ncbi:hypothetical protein HW452_05800 [Halomonas aquamarina]|uniref:Uncharacterized protein n=1 Tax=Vreelandella aquamarina TaxID=77097 RepID=A0ACC5VS64_9GAMM|nr:pilus assembly protein TadG-related protein [Halomonas aquamarina]MBZ5487036.1 hypothetical protein [Halomonas aquamarina]